MSTAKWQNIAGFKNFFRRSRPENSQKEWTISKSTYVPDIKQPPISISTFFLKIYTFSFVRFRDANSSAIFIPRGIGDCIFSYL